MSRLYYEGQANDRLAQDKPKSEVAALKQDIKSAFYQEYKAATVARAKGFSKFLFGATKFAHKLPLNKLKDAPLFMGFMLGIMAPVMAPLMAISATAAGMTAGLALAYTATAYVIAALGVATYSFCMTAVTGAIVKHVQTNNALNRDVANGTLVDRFAGTKLEQEQAALDTQLAELQAKKTAVAEKAARVLELKGEFMKAAKGQAAAAAPQTTPKAAKNTP